MHRFRSDSGAAAVEFALVVPLLILLVFGIVEFGRAYNIQNSLSAAAREGVRVMAIGNGTSNPVDTAWSSAPTLDRTRGTATTQVCTDPSVTSCATSGTCVAGSTARLKIDYTFTFLTNILPKVPQTITLTGIGVMRCGG